MEAPEDHFKGLCYLLLVLTLACCCKHVCCAPEDPGVYTNTHRTATFRIMFERAQLSVHEPMMTKGAPSLAWCAGYCNHQPSCVSFDFAPGSSVCRLYCLTPTYKETTPSQDCSVYGLVN